MSVGRYRNKPTHEASTTEAALAVMDADGLRALIREMIPWFDDALRARFESAVVDQAARNGSGWVPQRDRLTMWSKKSRCSQKWPREFPS